MLEPGVCIRMVYDPQIVRAAIRVQHRGLYRSTVNMRAGALAAYSCIDTQQAGFNSNVTGDEQEAAAICLTG